MCLALGVSMRDFAIVATDGSKFGPEGPDGRPTSVHEVPGGKLRKGGGGWTTVSGGSHCQHLLDGWNAELELANENQITSWIRGIDARHSSYPRELASWVTTAFHDGKEFHSRAYDEHGEVAFSSYATGEGMAAIFPRGIEDVQLQEELRTGFREDLGEALGAGSVEAIAGAVTRLFDRTREHTPYLGPVTDAVILWLDAGNGRPCYKRFTEEVKWTS